jgi:putative addiction module antidote
VIQVEIRAIGNSAGLILPKEALALLHAKKGDKLYLTETPEGFLLSPYNPETARQLEAADLIMREDRDVLRELAK